MLSVNTEGRRYHQVQSLRDLTRTNFPNGQIRFNWSIPAEESWNPSLSFFKIRVDFGQLYVNALLNNLDPLLGVGPSMFFGDSLWQQLEFRINGVTVNKQDNYIHQIASLYHRQCAESKNKSWGKMNFHQIDIRDRANQFSASGHGDYRISDNYISLATFGATTANGGGGNIAAGASLTLALTADVQMYVSIGDKIILEFTAGNNTGKIFYGTITLTTANSIVGIYDLPFVADASARACNMYVGSHLLIKDRENAPNYSKFESIWKPCLGALRLDEWLPGGDYEIILTPFPENQYRINALEYDANSPILDVLGGSTFEVINMDLYICSCQNKTALKEMSFIETRCQAKTLNTTSLNQKQFHINPKCHALSIAYQDNRVNTRKDISSSFFSILDDSTTPKNKNWELNLQRFFIQFDGEVLPNPIPDVRVNGSEDFITQHYWESQMYKMEHWDEIETLEEWKKRGIYFMYQWPRKNMSASEVQVSTEFSASSLPTGVRPQLLLFEHYHCKYRFELYHNYITGVKKTV